MKLSLKRIAAVALTVCLLGVAAGTVYGGGRGPAPQPKPQPKPQHQPQPQPKPQPQPAQQQKSASVPVIGSLSNGSTIGSLSRGSSIGSLSNGSSIGSLVPQKSGTQPMIGTIEPTKPQQQPKPQSKPKKTEPEQKIPQNDSPTGIGTLEPSNPPPQSRPAEQPKPVEPGPQVVQEAARKPAAEQPKQAQAQDPIIIMPRSVRAGNTSGGGSSNRNMPGYSGGDGSGPLIYNP